MAVSTLDGAAAGAIALSPCFKASIASPVAGRPTSLWSFAGIPGPGSFSSSLAGATLSSADAGSLWRGNPVSGNSYASCLSAVTSATAGMLYLIDRLWHNGGFTITSTAAQTVNSVAWPSRCPTSATDQTPSTNGYGVLLGVEVSVTTGAGTPTLTVGYTNAAGTSGKTGTNIQATAASAPVGSFFQLGLAAGDTGVRSVQSLTLSATWTSGTINLVAYRILAAVPATIGPAMPEADWYSIGSQRIYDNACLSFLFGSNLGGTPSMTGFLTETQG